MSAELLEIQPEEFKFTFELKKQSSCSVRLVNKSNYYVAFKVKTTSPKKYCVRPNTGVINPKSTCDFMVTMQAQRVSPPDMICKDKFLLQSTVVPVGSTEEDITHSTFAKDDGKYVEERKLRVILVSPPPSPVHSPFNGTLKQIPAYEASTLKDQDPSGVENLSPHHTVIEDLVESKMGNVGEVELAKDVEVTTTMHLEELKLVNDIEEMKSKLNVLELKLSEAEVTISKLTEERRLTTQEREILRQELALLRSSSCSKRIIRRVQVGFPFLFVCMVALISVVLGGLLHR